NVIYGHDILPVKLGQGQEIRSDLDLIRILDEEENWYQLLFTDQSSVDVLCRWVGDYQDLPAATNFNALIRYYKNKESREYLREAAIRFFDKKRLIHIPPKTYDLWNAESIQEETEKIIAHLDDLWSQAKEDELRCYVLQLEISLHHLMFEGTPEQKESATEVHTKITKALGRTAKTLELIEKDIWQVDLSLEPDQIIDLAYTFNPDRGFKCEGTESINTLKELGRFFAINPQRYEQDVPQTERRKFLGHHNHDQLVHTANLSDFLFEALKDEIHTQARLIDTKVYRANGEYNFKVSYGRSLQGYFKKEKINYEQDSWEQSGLESLSISKPSFGTSISKGGLSRYLAKETISKLVTLKGLSKNEFDKTGRKKLTKQFKIAAGHDVSIRRNKFIFTTTTLITITCGALYIHFLLKQQALASLALAQNEHDKKNWTGAIDILDKKNNYINFSYIMIIYKDINDRYKTLITDLKEKQLLFLLESKNYKDSFTYVNRKNKFIKKDIEINIRIKNKETLIEYILENTDPEYFLNSGYNYDNFKECTNNFHITNRHYSKTSSKWIKYIKLLRINGFNKLNNNKLRDLFLSNKLNKKFNPKHIVTVNKYLNMRTGPGKKYNIIIEINKNEKIEILDEQDESINDYRIARTKGGYIGWIWTGNYGETVTKISEIKKVAVKNNPQENKTNKSTSKSSVKEKTTGTAKSEVTQRDNRSLNIIPFKPNQIWKGSYYCKQGKTNLDFKIKEVDNAEITAIFDFNYKNQAIGSYSIKGYFNSIRREIKLKPIKWINRPSGYGMVGLSGRISKDGNHFSGKIDSSGCSGFDLTLSSIPIKKSIGTTIHDVSKKKLYGLIQNFYNTKGKWAGKFSIDYIEKVRIESRSKNIARIHSRYKYSPVPGQSYQSGYDQRVFIAKKVSGSWQITEMKGHMSASFKRGLQNAF
ncbi:SH3 domain-containing protein, partial [bacterium]|nr:SH3 domain-containing protein [bacterium]